MKKRTDLKSKYFKLKQYDFTKKDAKEAIKDLERFLRIFKKSLKNIKNDKKQ